MPELLILATLLGLSAFFSASESALFSLSRLRLALLSRESGPRARAIVRTMKHPNSALITILVGNNFANLGATSLATAALLSLFGERGIAIAVPCMTIVILLLSEVGPKTIAIRHPEKVSRLVIRPLGLAATLLWPLRALLGRVIRWVLTAADSIPAGGAAGDSAPALFRAAIEFGHDEGILAPFEKEIFDKVTDVHELVVREIMTPRTEIVALPLSTGVEAARRFVKRKSLSRVPVYQGRFENLVGLLHATDLLDGADVGRGLRPLLRPLFYVPESKPVVDLLAEFKQRGVHFAVAVEESGGIAGIATLEDVLEEIVGDISDERNIAHSRFRRRGPHTIIVAARMELEAFNDTFGVALESAGTETLGGYLMAKSGRVPRAGEVLFFDGLTFYVRRAEPNRVLEVEVTKLPLSVKERA